MISLLDPMFTAFLIGIKMAEFRIYILSYSIQKINHLVFKNTYNRINICVSDIHSNAALTLISSYPTLLMYLTSCSG